MLFARLNSSAATQQKQTPEVQILPLQHTYDETSAFDIGCKDTQHPILAIGRRRNSKACRVTMFGLIHLR
jgi:hypothetical protein